MHLASHPAATHPATTDPAVIHPATADPVAIHPTATASRRRPARTARSRPPGFRSTERAAPDRSYAELVRAIEAGEDDAWQQLITLLRPTVERVLACYRVDAQLRLDAAADTWEILLTSLDDVRHPERLEGWIATVARNRMNLHLRRRRRDCPTGDVERLRVALVPAASPADRVEREEARLVLQQAVARLSPREQEVIRCRAYTDRPEPLQSMQDRLGIPVGSVGPTLGRGVAKLRRDREVRRFLGAGRSAPIG